MISKLEAIISLNPEAEATQMADGSLVWHKNPTNITDEQITAKQSELQADYDAKEYQRKREAEYPSVQDLVVALYDTDDKAAIDSKRAEIKLKYPKP